MVAEQDGSQKSFSALLRDQDFILNIVKSL